MRSSPKARKKTAFVPRIIFQAVTTAGVIPFCAAAAIVACGGKSFQPIEPDADNDVILPGVACEAFDGGPCGVGTTGFDGGSDVVFTVAACGFDGSPCGVADVGFADAPSVAFDAFGVADVSFSDGPLGVALDAFGVADVGFSDAPLGVAADAFGGKG
jgi:hypothetical protein